jgi:hypothetical protein
MGWDCYSSKVVALLSKLLVINNASIPKLNRI